MRYEAPPCVENSERITAIYGGWQTFHDARLHRIVMDVEAETITADLTLNDLNADESETILAEATLHWEDVDAAALSYNTEQTWPSYLDHLDIVCREDWIETTLTAPDGIRGTIHASRVKVVSAQRLYKRREQG